MILADGVACLVSIQAAHRLIPCHLQVHAQQVIDRDFIFYYKDSGFHFSWVFLSKCCIYAEGWLWAIWVLLYIVLNVEM